MIETADQLSEIEVLKQQLEQSKSEIIFLKYQLEDLRRKIFGAKSERYISNIHSSQLSLLDVAAEEVQVVSTTTVEKHERTSVSKKKSPDSQFLS